MKRFLFAVFVLAITAFAAQQTINIGSGANDGTGDTLRTAFGKVNTNFTELYARSVSYTNVYEYGNSNLVIGTQGATNISILASNNTFVGIKAGQSNTIGYYNTALGFGAMQDNVGGFPNTAIGAFALNKMSTGSTMVAIGYRAGRGPDAGSTNHNSVYIGYRPAHEISDGDYDVFIGYESGYEKDVSRENTMIGALSGKNATNGNYLTSLGVNTFRFGFGNTNSLALGHSAGYYDTNGLANVWLGYKSGGTSSQNVDVTNIVAIGSYTSAGQSDIVVLGNQNQDVAIGTNRASYKIDVLDTNIDNAPVIRLARGVQGVNNSMNVLGFTNANYLHIGGKENRNNSYQGIGFGYNDGTALAPAAIGLHTTSNSGYTKGDVVIAVRDVTTDTAPTDALRVRSSGSVMLPRMNSNKLLYLDANTNIAEVTIGSGLTLTTGTLAASGGGGGTPGGSSGQLQFNDSSSFGGAAGVTVTQGTNLFVGKLTVTNTITASSGISVSGSGPANIQLDDDDASNYSALRASGTITSNNVILLPTTALPGPLVLDYSSVGTNQMRAVPWGVPNDGGVALAGGMGEPLVSDGTTGRFRSMRRFINQYDEFMTAASASIVGDLNWVSSVSGASSAFSTAQHASNIHEHPGQIRIRLGTSASSYTSMRKSAGSLTVNPGGGQIVWESLVLWETLDDGSGNYFTAQVGLQSGLTSTNSADGVYFRFAGNVSSGQIRGVCREDSAETLDSAVASVTAAADTWYHLACVINAGATSVDFYVNGTLIGTAASNVPDSNDALLEGYSMYGQGTLTATTDMFVDAHAFRQVLTNGRGF